MIKKAIKKFAATLGWQINKLNVASSPAYQTVQALKTHHINVVFDVGANIGQFANDLRAYGYKGKIISFEPLPEAYETLTELAKTDRYWIIHPRCAVGESIDQIVINVAENSVSSSILPMLNIHETIAPSSKYLRTELVSTITLDSVVDLYTNPSDNIFIKIDTQGYEWAVLDGASHTLKLSKGVLLELSLVPLYEGQKLWGDCINRLNNLQFITYSIQPSFVDLNTGQTLQVDGLFFRSKV